MVCAANCIRRIRHCRSDARDARISHRYLRRAYAVSESTCAYIHRQRQSLCASRTLNSCRPCAQTDTRCARAYIIHTVPRAYRAAPTHRIRAALLQRMRKLTHAHIVALISGRIPQLQQTQLSTIHNRHISTPRYSPHCRVTAVRISCARDAQHLSGNARQTDPPRIYHADVYLISGCARMQLLSG